MTKKYFSIFTVAIFSLMLAGCNNKTQIVQDELKLTGKPLTTTKKSLSSPLASPIINKKSTEVTKMNTAIIKTKSGEITIKLFNKEAPQTVNNFVKKAQTKFYEGLTFHRVEDWVVQGGDPKGNGTGGGEMATELNQVEFKRGSLGVARGADIKISNDAQFFICTKDCHWLTGQYTNFGEVVKGMEIVDQIKIGDQILKIEVK